MYRIKEAFRIFWSVLFDKYYYFASAAEMTVGGARCCFHSDEAAKINPKFLYLAGKMAKELSEEYGYKPEQ